MSVVLGVQGVSRRHQRGRHVVTAVDDVSFELQSGTLTALVGPSGSGKTTLLNLVLGGDTTDAGTIDFHIGGATRAVHIDGVDPPTWAELAIVPQALGLLSELTIAENIGLPVRFGAPPAQSVDDVMNQLGIAELADRSPAETSLGQQQRAAVGRALIVAPQLLVADEPTSHQDAANTDKVIASFSRLAHAGSCVFVATHDPRVVAQCDHVLEMRDGVVSQPTRP